MAAGGSAGIKAGGVPDVAVVATADGQAGPGRRRLHVQPGRGRAGTGEPGAPAGHRGPGGRGDPRPRATPTRPPGARAARRRRGLCTCDGAGHRRPAREILICQTGSDRRPVPHRRGRADICRDRRDPGRRAGVRRGRGPGHHDHRHRAQGGAGAGPRASPWAPWPRARPCWPPNMATMLALCTTDAVVDPVTLQAALRSRGRRVVQRHDRRRLHLDQRHGAGAGQRAGVPRRRPPPSPTP